MAQTWLIIFLAGVLTYLTRLSFIALVGRWQPPALLQRALRYVPPAVLSAIILPEMVIHDGKLITSPLDPRLIAGVLAMLVAWRTRNIFLTIVVGMAGLYLLMYLVH